MRPKGEKKVEERIALGVVAVWSGQNLKRFGFIVLKSKQTSIFVVHLPS